MPAIRNEYSEKSPYFLSKHAFLETYHFTLQYKDYCREYAGSVYSLPSYDYTKPNTQGGKFTDQVSLTAEKRERLHKKIEIIETTAKEVEPIFTDEFLEAVTGTKGFDELQFKIPLPRREYYRKRREFYYKVHKKRNE